jgi:phospholipase/carboxylesterase
MPQNVMTAAVTGLTTMRDGPRPQTRHILPQRQLDQLPSPAIMEELVARSMEIPLVRFQQSRMASDGSCALCLSDHIAGGPSEAFIDAHEFCHIHPLPESGIHLTLPRDLRDEVSRLGWGEPHPISLTGIMSGLMSIYLPRDAGELEIVLYLISQSCRFAQGRFAPATLSNPSSRHLGRQSRDE